MLRRMTNQTLKTWLHSELHDHIPLVRAMAIDVDHWAPEQIRLSAPLAPNSNDKGCGFGGSIASLLTLSGWSLLRSAIQQADIRADIYIQDSEIRYLKPAWERLIAIALWTAEEHRQWLEMLGSRGKARATVTMRLESGGVEAATMQARFVALRQVQQT